MKQFPLYLPEELYESLRREAFDNRISMSKLVISKIDLPPSPVKPTYVIPPEAKVIREKPKKDSQLCEHYALKGLCKKGCK